MLCSFSKISNKSRVIYFSSILVKRDINNYATLFPIDDCKVYEAKRLRDKYGTDFKIENFIHSIFEEQLSDEARSMALSSYMGSI